MQKKPSAAYQTRPNSPRGNNFRPSCCIYGSPIDQTKGNIENEDGVIEEP
jgi:hypothetical protein